MTTLVCNFSDVLGTPMPDGIARVTSGEVRPGHSTPSVIVPRIHEQPLVGGSATFPQVEPGNIVIHLIWGTQNTTIRTLVPDQETVTLSDCLQYQYSIPSDIETARQLAIAAQQAATAAESSASAANSSRVSAASSATAASQSADAASASASNAATSANEAATHEDTSLDAAAAAIAAAVSVAQFQGQGFPNGVVAAPVGSIYTDTAATNGAIRWIKARGTGNTGWEVEYGDTGWRDISGDVLVPVRAGARVFIRRTGIHVYLSADVLYFEETVSATTPFLAVPSGFRAIRTYRTSGSYEAGAVYTELGGTQLALREAQVGSSRFYTSYLTDNPWPTSLPGTPA